MKLSLKRGSGSPMFPSSASEHLSVFDTGGTWQMTCRIGPRSKRTERNVTGTKMAAAHYQVLCGAGMHNC
jgi:hypothetical protein